MVEHELRSGPRMTTSKLPSMTIVHSGQKPQRLYKGLYLVSRGEPALSVPIEEPGASESDRIFALVSAACLVPLLYVLLHVLHIF